MNPEIIQMRNDLALLRRKALRQREEAAGITLLIRLELPVYGEDPILRTDTAKVLQFTKRLHELKTDLVKSLAGIKALEEALGENE
ncbi:MAG: hypothetical protein NTX59_08290 [Elusimicrobia bacterium]|nr:hypothetical protein [Elusimicrobiota bacterium]